ncbi:MAG TPA: serine--tRNA ligase [Candidatus Woesearchaeota archaeon]|nr:serine--tRNA ligase [Candidatus Woesearchaeota archaeon]
MLDIKFILQNKEIVADSIKKRFQDSKLELLDELDEKYNKWKSLKADVDSLRFQRNSVSEEINKGKKEGKDVSELIDKAKSIPNLIAEKEKESGALWERILEIQLKIPNVLHESVPIGKNDSENIERCSFGEPKVFDFEVKNHAELCESLGIADFDASARTSGNGFFYLKGPLALLDQALIRYAIEFLCKKGYVFTQPPLMIRKRVCDGVLDFSFFSDMVYKIEGEDLYMIGTSEHPLVGQFVDQEIQKASLPIKLAGLSPCFRKEIGSHGLDEKGIFRTHQFNKVEQVIVCEPEDSYKYYDEILNNSIELFKGLGIPIRVFESCSGDLGDLKAKGADIEAWSPRQKRYFEVCSVSNLTDTQARRTNIRVFDGSKRYIPHTLNNTAIATSRAMVAILENFQTKKGTVVIPKVLRKYMFGMEEITGPDVKFVEEK